MATEATTESGPELSRSSRRAVRELFGAERFGPDRTHGLIQLPVPDGWRTRTRSPWKYMEPDGAILPPQGWKIHISTTPLVAQQTLMLVARICHAHRVAFKHLTSSGELHAANAKYADRGSAGKFITIYPASGDEFDRLLPLLDSELSGLPGPYILSDVRYGTGPVFARYGAFEEMRALADSGQDMLCIRRPDGTLEEDRRDPELHVPAYVSVPTSIKELVAERLNPSDENLSDLLGDLQAESAMHFSNGGGVYRLQSTHPEQYFVMKEGRRHAAWDFRGVDAFDRVHYEYSNLKVLASTGVTPQPVKLKVVEDHAFLIEEHIAGKSLYSWVASEYPFSYAYSPADYEPRALEVFRKLRLAVDAVHARGMAVMDLHPFNVIITSEGTVRLIDLESSCPLDASHAPAYVGTPGYMPKGQHTPRERDEYALLQLAIALFYPVASVAAISDDATRVLCAHLKTLYSSKVTSLVDELWSRVRHLDAPGLAAGWSRGRIGAADVPELKECLTRGFHSLRDDSATRLPYPLVDVMPGSFAELCIESGLAGIMLSLGKNDPNADRDLAVLRDAAVSTQITGAGLLSGATGVAVMLASRGEPELAAALFDRREAPVANTNISLRNGTAGELIGALLMARYTANSRYLSEARMFLEDLTQMIETPPAVLHSVSTSTAQALGLVHGWSGVSLAISLAAQAFGEPSLYRAARAAIAHDMENMVKAPDGSLQADDGHRMMPYISDGSAGLGLALSSIPAKYREVDDGSILGDIRLACRARVCVSGGLFHGRIGLLLSLVILGEEMGLDTGELLQDELSLLDSYLFGAQEEAATFVPAEDNRRLSLNLAEGAAGWILALRALDPSNGESPIQRQTLHQLGVVLA